MADQPYINWFTSDFLNGVMDLTAEQIGVYAIILNLIADKGSPIDDDPRWIARRAGCQNTRHANRILTQLAQMDKIERRNGLIGNARMLAEVRRRGGKSKQASEAAHIRWDKWRVEHKPQLPLEKNSADASGQPAHENAPKNTPKKRIYSESNRDLAGQKKPQEKTDEPKETAKNDMRTHFDSRAGANPDPDPDTSKPNQSNGIEVEAPESSDGSVGLGLDSDRDLVASLQRVSESAGFVPRGGSSYAAGIDQVREWRDSGIDLEATILPVIERTLRQRPEPTNSLKRFDQAIRHEHALQLARRSQDGSLPAPTPEPILTFDNEVEPMQALRADLLKRLGVHAYSIYCHRVRFVSESHTDGRTILFVYRDPKMPGQLLDDNRISIVPAVARRHGFDDVWERTARPKRETNSE